MQVRCVSRKSDHLKHVATDGHMQERVFAPVQLEGVGAVAVGGFLLEVFGQVDDHDGVKGAFLGVTAMCGGCMVAHVCTNSAP